MAKKPPDLRMPRNPLAHLTPQERERALKLFNKHLRVPRTATVYETFSDFDPHKWTMGDFENMRRGALSQDGAQRAGEMRRGMNKARDQQIRALSKAGKTPKEISKETGVSYRRVLQIISHNK